MTAKKTDAIYQLKITLLGSSPPIWRRLLIGHATTLTGLHYAIQDAMGWTNSHLHEFNIDGVRYTDYFDETYEEYDKGSVDDREVTLRKTLGAKVKQFLYIYDFGDCWEHHIAVEKMCPRNKKTKYPCCTGGENECPPEDVGGIGGYYSFLEAYNNPDHEDHEMLIEWCGPGFDPGRFDLRDTNKRLRIHLTKKLTRMAYEMDAEILRQASVLHCK